MSKLHRTKAQYPDPADEHPTNNSKKLLENRNQSFLVVGHFTGKLELVSNILWLIVGKSKEFNNQGLKVSRNFQCYFFFFTFKKQWNTKAPHEIIWDSSLCIIFVEFSFKPVYPTMVWKISNLWKVTISGRCTCESNYWLLIYLLTCHHHHHHSSNRPCSHNSPPGSIYYPSGDNDLEC